jgi:predicted nucleotidyltransferase
MSLEERIIELLRPLSPRELFIFGSRSHGMAGAESDIDLVVVLPDSEIPRTFAEKMANIRRVRKLLADFNREYALDLLVFTRPEWEEFQRRRPVFAAEITERGRRIA